MSVASVVGLPAYSIGTFSYVELILKKLLSDYYGVIFGALRSAIASDDSLPWLAFTKPCFPFFRR